MKKFIIDALPLIVSMFSVTATVVITHLNNEHNKAIESLRMKYGLKVQIQSERLKSTESAYLNSFKAFDAFLSQPSCATHFSKALSAINLAILYSNDSVAESLSCMATHTRQLHNGDCSKVHFINGMEQLSTQMNKQLRNGFPLPDEDCI